MIYNILKCIPVIKVIYDDRQIIIGCSYFGCRITKAMADKIYEVASNCRCTFCEEDRSKGVKPSAH